MSRLPQCGENRPLPNPDTGPLAPDANCAARGVGIGDFEPARQTSVKILLSVVLAILLLLWGAVWWVTQERLPSPRPLVADPPTAAIKPESPALLPQSSPTPALPARPEAPTPALSPTESAVVQGGEVYKPKTERPAPAPPTPVKPNAQGVIDLSSDPSTGEFAKFLELGRARRLEEERARREQPPTATPQ